MLEVRIQTRGFLGGFEINIPAECLVAKRVFFSSMQETRVFDSSGAQIARLEKPSIFRNAYNIIITGGALYKFSRDGALGKTWKCEGEGKLLRVSEHRYRRFSIFEHEDKIADCSKAWFFNDYSVSIYSEQDAKLVICTILALSLSEHQDSYIPV